MGISRGLPQETFGRFPKETPKAFPEKKTTGWFFETVLRWKSSKWTQLGLPEGTFVR